MPDRGQAEERGDAPRPAELWVARLGQVPYAEGLDIQEQVRARRQAGEIPDTLLLLEHPPVYTKGRRTGEGELPMGDAFYAQQGIEVIESDRGGQVTYHGPGQLVGYPIVKLARGSGTADAGLALSVREYVTAMEAALVAALSDEGIEARAGGDLIGVWAGEAKIGSIGVHVSRGVTSHGFAVNVDNDLEPFSWIVPCGMPGGAVTSLSLCTGRSGGLDCFSKRTAWRLAQQLGLRQRLVSRERLLDTEPVAAGRAAVPA